MRVAVACQGLDVAPRFDLCEGMTFYTITKGIITECQNIPNPSIPTAELLSFFLENDISALICNAIIVDHAKEFCSNGVEVVAGIKGTAREAVQNYLSKQLSGVDEICNWEDEEDEAVDVDSLESLIF